MPVEQRIAELGLVLPKAPRGLGHYVPWAITGNLVVTSGQLPWDGDRLAYTGAVGADQDAAAGYRSARLCALNAIAQLKEATGGDLDRVTKIVLLEGHINCVPGFTDHAPVIDGASDLFHAVFLERDQHARAVYGLMAMPMNATTQLHVHAEIATE